METPRFMILLKRFSSKKALREIRKQKPPIQKLAKRMRTNEKAILRPPRPPSFFLNSQNKMKKVLMPDKEVARARPAILSGNIKRRFKTTLTASASPVTFVGVTVSLRAKKQLCNVRVAP